VKIKQLIIIIIVVILGFFLYKNFESKKNNDVEREELTTSNLFEKNRACVSDKEKIETEIGKINKESWNEKLVEVFYSQERDTCLYVSEVETSKLNWRILKRLVDFRLAAGSEPIVSCEYPVFVRMSSLELEFKTKGVEMSSDMKVLLENDRSKPYESWCGEFDKEVLRLKTGV